MPRTRLALAAAALILASPAFALASAPSRTTLTVRGCTLESESVPSSGAAAGIQVLHLRSGVPSDGLAANVDRWYIGRWDGNENALAAALGSGNAAARAARGASSATTPAPLQLAIRLLVNPSRAALEVQCDLPGTEPARLELFDAQGRRVAEREIAARAASTVRLGLAQGRTLPAGAYWLRLTQGARPAVTRMVVLER